MCVCVCGLYMCIYIYMYIYIYIRVCVCVGVWVCSVCVWVSFQGWLFEDVLKGRHKGNRVLFHRFRSPFVFSQCSRELHLLVPGSGGGGSSGSSRLEAGAEARPRKRLVKSSCFVSIWPWGITYGDPISGWNIHSPILMFT